MQPDDAKKVYEEFVDEFKKVYSPDKVFDGEFQAYMNVEIHNDGPVTVMIDTSEYQCAIDNLKLEKEKRSRFKLTKDPKPSPKEISSSDSTPKEDVKN